MKKVLLLTTIGLVLVAAKLSAQPNVFNPADPIVIYNSSSPPTTNWGNVQKWVVTNRNLGWTTSSFKSYHFNGISFRVKFPKTYAHNVADGKKYPVMLFWHGAGEKGSVYDNELQLLHGGQLFRDRVDNGQFDGFLIYPQNTGGFFGATYYGPMIQMLDSLAKYCKLDVDKVLVDGLSAGGSATFDITAGYPTRITKAAPSAAAATGLIPYIPNFVHIPIWFCTGGLDTNPSPSMSQQVYDGLSNAGAEVRWTFYPTQGHFVWYSHWQEPDFVPYMNDMHKANPLVYFQRNLFCPDSPTNARMGVSPGFFAYEWQVNTGSGYTNIPGATSNEYIATSYGTYRVRFKRTSTGAWSDYSPKPVVVGPKTTTITPDITVKGLRSKVLPAPDGSTTVPLRIASGFIGYEYWKVNGDSVKVSSDSVYQAPVGVYRGRVKEQFGCNAFFSNTFTVIPANGVNKPDAAKNLTAFGNTTSTVQLDWSDNPNPAFNETGFEIYRGTAPGGPYTLIAITGPNVLSYLDQGLLSNTNFYYLVRAVNNTSAAPNNSNEASAKTKADNSAPTAPGNLRYTRAGRFSVDLEWSPSTDDAAVSKYDIYVNGVKLYTTTDTAFIVNELDSFQRYNFVVRAKDPTGNVSAPSNQISVVTKMQGLFYKYYHGSFGALPDFNTLQPVIKTGNTATTDISVRTQNDNFAFIWKGYIKVPTTGTYIFETCSDDGSKLYVNMPYDSSAVPTVYNDFTHGPTCQTGQVALIANVQYSIIATFFEAGSGEQMQLWWDGPGFSRQQIPSTAFTETFTPSGTAPTAPSGLNATATGFDRISLSWTDNSNNETGFEVVRSSTGAAGVFVNVGTTGAGVNNFIDSGRNASTQYWYKVRAIGTTGESAYSGTATATTQALPAAPAAPTVLSRQVMSASQINLTWNDNSNNETVFEIYRSTNNNANFRLITTIAGGAGATKNYNDVGLFANVTYFYKVRAIGTGGPSAYTNEVNGKTLNTVPVVNDVLDFTIHHSTPFVLPLTASDADGDAITFSSDDLPWFATLNNGSNGTAELTFNPFISDQGGYVMTIVINDGNGGADTTYLNMQVNDNYPPTLNAISNVTLDEGSSTSINLVANDTENPAGIGWSFTGLPSFAQFNHNGSGGGTLQLNPGYAASGVYNVTVMVDDGSGAWTTRSFIITVNEKDPNERILVSIRATLTAPLPWNNMPSQSISSLKNTDGVTTTVGAAVQNSWQFNLNNLGGQTGNDSGIYPDTVMKDAVHWGYFIGNNTIDTSILTISGLNPARKYTLVFFGSSVYNLYPDNGTTTYRVGAQSVSLAVQNNTTNKVALNNLSPNGSGVITVQMIGDPHPDLGGWLNAFEIVNQYEDGTPPATPIDLTGEFVEHQGAVLNWKDIAYNEFRYNVYRATNINGPYTLLNPGSNNANTTTYKDATAVPVTQYYYYITGSNTLTSPPSDTVSVLTGNNSPLINDLQNVFVKTQSVFNEDFTVTDNAGDIVSVTAPNLPPFITLQPMGGTNYRLVVNGSKEYLGLHNVSVVATDNKGGSNSQDITIMVADKRTRSFYINFGADGNAAPAPWNDFVGFTYAGKQLLNLKDEAGTTSAISIRADSSWGNTFRLGYLTGNDSGVYPDSVLQGGVLSTHTTARRFTFLGLNPAKRYNVAFIGSSNDGLNASADYSASGATTTSLNARYNQHRVAYLNRMTPSGSNSIQVSVTKQASSSFMYLNGIVLEEFDDTVAIMNPIHLYAEPASKTSVNLFWADRTNIETGYEVFRATNPAGPWTLVTTTGSNVTNYTNTGLTANTKYYFRVRARKTTAPTAISDSSNTEVTITPKSIVNVNLTFTYPAASPWNNTNFNPDAGKQIADLKNDLNQSTGINMTVTKMFNGQNDDGMQPGSGVVPDAVMRSCYWIDRTQQAQFKVTGLNHSRRYRFGFFGSINSPWDGNYVTTYNIGSRTVYLNSYRNTSEIAYIGDVQPDENGEVLLNVSTIGDANYGFTSAIVIWAYDDATGGAVLNRVNPADEGSDETREEQLEIVSNAELKPVIVEENELKNVRIQAYPNPFHDNIKIDFNNSVAGNKVQVDIVDMTGRTVFRRDAGNVPVGMNTLRLDVSNANFTPGVYIVRLTINGQVANTAKLIKARK